MAVEVPVMAAKMVATASMEVATMATSPCVRGASKGDNSERSYRAQSDFFEVSHDTQPFNRRAPVCATTNVPKGFHAAPSDLAGAGGTAAEEERLAMTREAQMSGDKSQREDAQAQEKTVENEKSVRDALTVPDEPDRTVLPGPPLTPRQQKEVKRQQAGDARAPLETAAPSKRTSDHLDEEE